MADGHGFPVHTRKGLGEDAFRFSHDGMATTFEIVIVGHEQEYARQAAAAASAARSATHSRHSATGITSPPGCG